MTHTPTRRRITATTPYARAAKRIQSAMRRCGAVSPTIDGERGAWTVLGYMLPDDYDRFHDWFVTFDLETYRG